MPQKRDHITTIVNPNQYPTMINQIDLKKDVWLWTPKQKGRCGNVRKKNLLIVNEVSIAESMFETRSQKADPEAPDRPDRMSLASLIFDAR